LGRTSYERYQLLTSQITFSTTFQPGFFQSSGFIRLVIGRELDHFSSHRLHRTVIVCYFISDKQRCETSFRSLDDGCSAGGVLFVALGVHVVVVPTRTPLVNEETTLTRLPKRRWYTSKLTDVSMKIRLQTLTIALL